MEPEETATIVRLVKSVFPQQPIDRATYDTWHLVIGHLDFAAAQAAVIAQAHSEKFCAAADIIREAERARKSHPSSRTAAEAIYAANWPELDPAEATPATREFLTARQALDGRLAARMLGIAAEDDPRQHAPCPWCHAAPGERCVNAGTGKPTRTHQARAQAVREVA
jgi:hypothetical protein